MSPLTPPAPDVRFAAIIGLLCRTVGARGGGGRLAGPLVILIWTRLRRMGARFAALAARLAAGRRPVARRRARAPRPAPPASPSRLPRGFAWLVRRVPEAASAASQLQHLLAEPEMAALLAAAPQAGRILRPLCRMLGVRPPAVVALPPRPAERSANSRPSASFGPPPSAAPPPRRAEPVPLRPPRACGPPVVPA